MICIRSQLVSNYFPTYKRSKYVYVGNKSATLGTLFSTSASFNRMRQSTAFVVCILYFVLKVWYILIYMGVTEILTQVQQAAVQSVIIQEEIGMALWTVKRWPSCFNTWMQFSAPFCS